MADSKFRESLRDFLTQYPLWIAGDQFLDSKWGKKFLGLLGSAVVIGIGWIGSLFTHLDAGWKNGLLGASVAFFLSALVIYLTREKETTVLAPIKSSPDEIPPMRDAVSAISVPSPESPNQMPIVTFNTANLKNRHIEIGRKPKKLRFVMPNEQVVEELPATVPLGKGRLVIKQFTRSGFLIDEYDTIGDYAKAEIYFDEALAKCK